MIKEGVADNVTPEELQELLRQLGNDGILALQCIRDQIEMNKRKKILKDHPYKPKYNKKKGRWYTRFKTDEGEIIQRSRADPKELEDLIVEFYTNGFDEEEAEPNIYTFDKAHDRWMEAQREYGKSNNSIRRYETDWARFFSDSKFKDMDLFEITPRDIEVFMIDNIKRYNLKRRSSDSLYACVSGVFYNAVMDRKLDAHDNPCLYVDKKKFIKFYNVEDKTPEERTVSPEELAQLISKIDSDIERNPSYIYPYGVKLALLTGMRVGEIAGLRWGHVYDSYIKICESEKYDVVEKRYFQSKTKNSKVRTVPITDHLREFLDTMKDLQSRYGIVNDFVLSFDNQKLRCKNLTAYMNHKCEQIKFSSHKSIHAIRRTFNSYLRFSGVSATEAGSIIGNTPKVNDNHYTYDIQSIETKKAYVSDAELRMINPTSG